MLLWKKVLEKVGDFKKYENLNIVEATHFTRIVCRLMGVGVRDMKVLPNDEIEASLSWWSVLVSSSWFCIYSWCTFTAMSFRQEIQGSLYKSMVKYYGEYMEMIITYVFTCHLWVVLTISSEVKMGFWAQQLKIDTGFRKIGIDVKNAQIQMHLYLIVIVQILYNLFRCASTYYFISAWMLAAPLCKIFQIWYSYNIIIICLMEYYFSAVIVENRHKYLNQVLQSIIDTPYGNPKVIIVKGKNNLDNNGCCSLEMEYVEKLNIVGKQYTMIHDLKVGNDYRFGGLVALLTLLSYVTIVMRMFYMMEATAGGLYRDLRRYLFFIYCNSEFIFISLFSIFGMVKAAERVYNQDGKTSTLVHRIINQDISETITKRASLLSMQLLHQRHKFTANGLFNIDNPLLLTTLGSVTTYLIILLQFATSSAMDNILDVDNLLFGSNVTLKGN